jgi:hypothetical protein
MLEQTVVSSVNPFYSLSESTATLLTRSIVFIVAGKRKEDFMFNVSHIFDPFPATAQFCAAAVYEPLHDRYFSVNARL